MDFSYAKRSSIIYLALLSTMVAGICESVIVIVDQTMAAPIRQSRTKVTDISFAAPEKISTSTTTIQGSLLLRPVKTDFGPASKQQSPKVSNLWNKVLSQQNWQ